MLEALRDCGGWGRGFNCPPEKSLNVYSGSLAAINMVSSRYLVACAWEFFSTTNAAFLTFADGTFLTEGPLRAASMTWSSSKFDNSMELAFPGDTVYWVHINNERLAFDVVSATDEELVERGYSISGLACMAAAVFRRHETLPGLHTQLMDRRELPGGEDDENIECEEHNS